MLAAGRRRAATPRWRSRSCGRSSRDRSSATSSRRWSADAYATFDDPDVVPLRDSRWRRQLWLAELFHGPTLAFKDVALQLVGRLFDHELARRGPKVTIVGATSGDTGSAAIEACRDREAIEIVILHPAGRVSEVQRRQMTTVDVAQRPQPGRRGHVRRLPGPGQGPVRRRALPRPGQPVGGQLDQLGPGDGPDRLLRDLGRPAHRWPRAGRLRRAHRQLRQRVRRLRRPAHGPARSPSSSWPATPTTSSPGSSSRRSCRWTGSSPR